MLNAFIALTTLSIGLFAGVMLTLVVILQRQWDRQDQATYVPAFRSFLRVAKGNPVIAALTFAGFLGPFGLAAQAYGVGSPDRALWFGGAGAVFLIGCLGVTLRLNFPIYDRAMGWQTADDAQGWQEVRRRFFALNGVRLGAACATFLLVMYGALA